ncbi:MAG: hypothetical protein FJW40_16230 [Acidobacteria bacterium]|nr:hypothetical protein [Acidobacteriota bacterium]
MTLRSRLILITIGLVAAAVIAFAAIAWHALVEAAIGGAVERASAAGQSVKRQLLERTAREPDAELWQRLIANDPALERALSLLLTETASIAEIAITGADGTILASSVPARKGRYMDRLPALATLQAAGTATQIADIFAGRDQYETRTELARQGRTRSEFTIHVISSMLFFRGEIMAQMRKFLPAAVAALALSVAAAFWIVRLALRPLEEIGVAVETIARGDALEMQTATREAAIVQEKLRLLGDQLRQTGDGPRQAAVASRLAAIQQLTGRVAHEIKNPLNSIALRLELLRSAMSPQASESLPELDVISQEVARLDRVVRTFLDFTRPVELRAEPVDLRTLLQSLLDLAQPELDAYGIGLAASLPEGPAPYTTGDEDLLRQALLNILRNAIDVMPQGGRLRVDLRVEGPHAVVDIADSGPGIPESNRDKVFQLYFTTKQKGSGIGLAMSFRAAQLHGGTLEIEGPGAGDSGRGACFRMRLPLRRA